MTYQLASKLLCELLSLERECQKLLKENQDIGVEEALKKLIKEKVEKR